MYRQLVKTAAIGGLGLFFIAVFGTFGYFMVTTAGETSLSVTISMLVIFIIFVIVGFLMALRAARLITGDAKRISEYAFSSKDISAQSSPPVASPDEGSGSEQETNAEAESAEDIIDATETEEENEDE